MKKHVIKNLDETKQLAEKIAAFLEPSDILCLTGDLGAGKTTFSQYLAAALGVTEHVTSPTFNIVNVYEGRMPVYHFDVYRISDSDEMYDIGYEEYFFGNGVCLVEWADIVRDLLPDEAIWMDIRFDKEGHRVIHIHSDSQETEARLTGEEHSL